MESPIRRMSTDSNTLGYISNEFSGHINSFQGPYQQGLPYIQQFQSPVPQHSSPHQNQIIHSNSQQFQPIHQQHTTHHQTPIHQPSPQHFQNVNQGYAYHPQHQIQQQLPITMVIKIYIYATIK